MKNQVKTKFSFVIKEVSSNKSNNSACKANMGSGVTKGSCAC